MNRHASRMRGMAGPPLRTVIAMLALASALHAQDQPPRPAPLAVWAPKPTATAGYVPPQRPWVKLADLKARHKNDPSWRELVVDDGRLTGEYVAAPPKTT